MRWLLFALLCALAHGQGAAPNALVPENADLGATTSNDNTQSAIVHADAVRPPRLTSPLLALAHSITARFWAHSRSLMHPS